MVNSKLPSVVCVVPGCNNTTTLCPEKTFFQLSAHEERYQHWLLVCKREDILENFTECSSNLAVCSDHFISDDFENTSQTQIKASAVPTVFPLLTFGRNNDCVEDVDNVAAMKVEDFKIEMLPEVGYFSRNDNTKTLNQLCRLCANITDDAVYLFNAAEKNLHLVKKINTSLPITVKNTDLLPKQLCRECVIKLNMCYDFAEMCLVAEEKLISLVEADYFLSCPISKTPTNQKPAPASNMIKLEHNNFSSITVVDGGTGYAGEKAKMELESKNVSYTFSEPYYEENEEDRAEGSVDYSCPLCLVGNVSSSNFDTLEEHNDKTTDKIEPMVFNDLNVHTSESLSIQNEDSATVSIDVESKIFNDTAQSMSSKAETECSDSTFNGGNGNWWSLGEYVMASYETDSVQHVDVVKDGGTCSSITCRICHKAFKTVGLCLIHSKVHFERKCYPCSVCDSTFVNKRQHTYHCRQHTLKINRLSCKSKRLTCDACEKRFNNQRTFLSHSCATPEPKQHRCDVCKKSYSTRERLAFHQRFHEGAKANICDKCGRKFDYEGTLYYHIKMVHEGERRFTCNVCNKRFYSNSRLIAHKRVHTGERPFECEVCGRRFYDRDTLKGHYITHMAVKPFQCDLCGVCWGRKSMLNQHMRTRHLDENTSPRRAQSLIHYYCKMCDVTFTNSTDVLTHKTTHWKTGDTKKSNSMPDKHICEYCGESFALVSALVSHRKQNHPDEKPYICGVCKETSHTLHEARLHRDVHTANQGGNKTAKAKEDKSFMFVCEACGNTFTERRRFLRHMREHKVNHLYKCQTCGKQLIDKQRLTVHMRLHTGEKPYMCNVCGKAFSQTSALYTHALLHTGEKPHPCDICGKAFRIKADRDNHRRTHTGEKPYKCQYCGQTFRTGQVYYQHRMIHTGERRFPCDVCGKAFKRSHTLVVHKRIHTGEKPNVCEVCGKCFRQRSDMRKHRAQHATAD